MIFRKIDKGTWDRKECFEHFINVASCSYSITVNVDITKLYQYIKEKQLRFYPTFTWIICKCVNSIKEFRMGYDQEGNVGYFDYINPCYSVLNEDTKVMVDLCTEYNDNFILFYKDMVNSLDSFKSNKSYRTNFYPNFFIVSCLPWMTYSAFNVNNEGNQPFLFPMVTWGKYYKENSRVLIPVTIQIHHAAADGYHCSLFYSKLEEVVSNLVGNLN